MAADRDAAERAIRAFLKALGHDPESDPELANTPKLVTEAFQKDFLSGYSVDVSALLASESTRLGSQGKRGLVVVRDIGVATMCPHHLLPAIGRATVAYLPGERLIGIGAVARVVDAFARRLTLQESIGESVVQALSSHAGAQGAYCRITLSHACLSTRGAREMSATVVTVARSGQTIVDAALDGGAQ
jgi:GTP cyclohydrolase I